jgi:hypothetical protein
MMNETDKFFKEKLGTFERSVPASAWNKVERNISAKGTQGWWLKIAASVAIFSAVFLLAYNFKNDSSKTIAENSITNAIDSTPIEKEKTPNTGTVTTPAEDNPEGRKNKTAEKVQKKKQAKNKNAKDHASQKLQMKNLQPSQNLVSHDNSMEPVRVQQDEPIPAIEEETIAIAEVANLNDTGNESESEKSVTLVYSAEEVNAKYLNKNTITEATSDPKKSSTLRKLLDKAYDLKHNQDPVGELRQKKNEILALNFKNEKQRSQNR